MKSFPLSKVLPAFLGFAGMAIAGWHFGGPSADSQSSKNDSQTASSAKSSAHGTRPQRPEDPSAAQMRPIRNAGSLEDKLRASIDLASTLSPSEFPAWVEGDRFDSRSGPELTIFRMALFDRWEREDPAGLISWAIKNNYGQGGRGLRSLLKTSPQLVIEHFKNHPAPRDEVRSLTEIAKNHPELALARLKELSSGKLLDRNSGTSDLLIEIAKKSSPALEAILDTLPPSLRNEAETALSGQRLATAFSTEVDALSEKPNGWKTFYDCARNNEELGTQLLKHLDQISDSWKHGMSENYYSIISEKNGKDWFHTDLLTAGFSEEQAKKIKTFALGQIAYKDPAFALRSLQSFEITAEEKARIISSAIRNSQNGASSMEDLINLLSSEEEKEMARKQANLSENPKKVEPTQWLNQLTALDSQNDYSILRQSSELNAAQIEQLRDDFKSLSIQQQQAISQSLLRSNYAEYANTDFVGDALRTLIINPVTTPQDSNHPEREEKKLLRESSSFAVRLAIDNPSAAVSWVDSLPDGNEKSWAYKNVAMNWRQYDPQAVDSWVKTLPATTRKEVTDYLKTQR